MLELASVLKLPKTLDLLNRIGALAKTSSGSSEDCLSNCQNSGAGGKLSLGTNAAHLMRNIVARPLLCLCTVFLQLFVMMSFAPVNMATQYRYLLTMVVAAACSIVPTRGALRVEAYAGVFVALFDGANASLLRTAGASLHATYAFAFFTAFALSALHAHSYVGIIASLCASHVSFGLWASAPTFCRRSRCPYRPQTPTSSRDTLYCSTDSSCTPPSPLVVPARDGDALRPAFPPRRRRRWYTSTSTSRPPTARVRPFESHFTDAFCNHHYAAPKRPADASHLASRSSMHRACARVVVVMSSRNRARPTVDASSTSSTSFVARARRAWRGRVAASRGTAASAASVVGTNGRRRRRGRFGWIQTAAG